MFKTIDKNVEAIIIEKKSKFIANLFCVETEKEAEEILDQVKKRHHDARHNCYAYRIITENGILQKQSDDGEPSGTAGTPMLNMLEKKELVNVLIIVTRYFGGILLGTGGLVRAYSEALKQALEKAGEINKEEGYIIEIVLGYENISKFEYLCSKNNINIIDKDYSEKIKMIIEISEKEYTKIVEKGFKNNFQNITVNIKDKKYIKIK